MQQALIGFVLLGLTQGLTEFLPVSSSAHLSYLTHILFPLMGWHLDNPLSFYIFLHLATFFAMLAFFFKDILELFRPFSKNIPLFANIVIADIITVVIALKLKWLVVEIETQPRMVSAFLFSMGLLLLASRQIKKKGGGIEAFKWQHALMVGIAQGLAVFPGISRSGITIIALLLMGIAPKEAFFLSFLLGLPVVFGANVLDLFEAKGLPFAFGGQDAAAFVVAFIAGLFALRFLKKVVIADRLHLFGIYCVVVSVIIGVLFRGAYGFF